MKRVFCAMLLFPASVALLPDASADEWKAPEDFERAQEEAERAVRRTGPNGPRVVSVALPGESAGIESVSVGIVGLGSENQGSDNARLPTAPGVGIVGLGSEIQGTGDTIQGEVVSLQEAMSDLGARQTDTAVVVDLKGDVLFDFDKAEIRPEAGASLAKLALVIRSKGKGKVLIEGHTDSKGTAEYNQKLSERRARAVKEWLVSHFGFSPQRFLVRGWGETKPVAPNVNADGSDNPEGRALNRRVTVTIPVE